VGSSPTGRTIGSLAGLRRRAHRATGNGHEHNHGSVDFVVQGAVRENPHQVMILVAVGQFFTDGPEGGHHFLHQAIQIGNFDRRANIQEWATHVRRYEPSGSFELRA